MKMTSWVSFVGTNNQKATMNSSLWNSIRYSPEARKNGEKLIPFSCGAINTSKILKDTCGRKPGWEGQKKWKNMSVSVFLHVFMWFFLEFCIPGLFLLLLPPAPSHAYNTHTDIEQTQTQTCSEISYRITNVECIKSEQKNLKNITQGCATTVPFSFSSTNCPQFCCHGQDKWRCAPCSKCSTMVLVPWRDGQNHQMMWPPALQQHPCASLRKSDIYSYGLYTQASQTDTYPTFTSDFTDSHVTLH